MAAYDQSTIVLLFQVTLFANSQKQKAKCNNYVNLKKTPFTDLHNPCAEIMYTCNFQANSTCDSKAVLK